MNLSIVRAGNLVVLNRVCQVFPLDNLLPSSLAALYWESNAGRLESLQGIVENINELPDWAIIVGDEFNRLMEARRDQVRIIRDQKMAQTNGNVRKNRLIRDRQDQLEADLLLLQSALTELQRR